MSTREHRPQQLVEGVGQRTQADHGEQTEPEQEDGPPRLPRQHAVDDDLEHRQDAAEQGEGPQGVLDGGVLLAADEDDRPAREHGDSSRHEQAYHPHRSEALQQRSEAGLRDAHRREGKHHDELGQEQHRLDQDQAAGVQAGLALVQRVAGHQDVDVGECEEGQQRIRVVDRLSPQRTHVVFLGVLTGFARVPECEPADDHGDVRRDDHAEQRGELRRPPDDQDGAHDESGHPRCHVDQGEGEPPALALQDPRLGAHHRQRCRGEADERRRTETVEPDHLVDHRSQDQAQPPEAERRLDPDPQDELLDLVHVVGRGHDAPRGGRLQRERGHHDHEQQTHQGRQGAVVTRAEESGGEDGEEVGRDVHDAHRDRQASTSAQVLPLSHHNARVRPSVPDPGLTSAGDSTSRVRRPSDTFSSQATRPGADDW